jgi:hypothetical protein
VPPLPKEVQDALEIKANDLSFYPEKLNPAIDWDAIFQVPSPFSEVLFPKANGQSYPSWFKSISFVPTRQGLGVLKV